MALKSIHFIRHAKSSWKDSSVSDFDRPLNKRGKRDAPFMAKKFSEKYEVDFILSSSARRTKDTSRFFAKELSYSYSDILFLDELYLCGDKTLLNVINKIDNSVNSVIILNHNPAITEIANKLQQDKLIDNIPTCGIVSLGFKSKKWSEISTGKLINFTFPKQYFPK